jgi:Uma2 family endonuclease
MAIEITRYRFTADAYERLAASGVLAEDDRVELLGGEIVAMSPVGPRHVWCVTRLTGHLVGRLGDAYPVSVQSPIRLGAHDEPQPDLAVLRPEADQGRLPVAADVLLVIEVAETSRDYDRGVKLPRYAQADIPESWLLDLTGPHLERHTEPGPEGYQQITIARRGQSLASTVVPGLTIDLDTVLGRPGRATR